MTNTYVSADIAAFLTGMSVQWIRKKAQEGSLPAEAISGDRGQGGIMYQIPLESLPAAAQLQYYIGQANDASICNADLVGYRERHGDEGLGELLRMQKAVLAAQGMRNTAVMNLLERMERLAGELGVSSRTLHRWVKQYEANGLAGLMRKGRKDAGQSRTMCLEARRFVVNEYLSPERRRQEAILAHLREHAHDMGFDACFECPYRAGSENRDALMGTDEIAYYPECDQPGEGIIVPKDFGVYEYLIAFGQQMGFRFGHPDCVFPHVANDSSNYIRAPNFTKEAGRVFSLFISRRKISQKNALWPLMFPDLTAIGVLVREEVLILFPKNKKERETL